MPYAFSPANGAGSPIIRRAKTIDPNTGATITEGGPMQPQDIPRPGMIPRPMMPTDGGGDYGGERPSMVSAGIQVGRTGPRPMGMFGTGTRLSRSAQYRAKGGPVTKGNEYVVGERGPELFVPDKDGKVISHVGMNKMRDRMKKNRKGKKRVTC